MTLLWIEDRLSFFSQIEIAVLISPIERLLMAILSTQLKQ